MQAATGPDLQQLWRRTSALPGGKWLFSYLLGRHAPYSGGLGAVVLELAPGHCRVRLQDRGRLRNHLNSLHAMALANLGELATGLALLNGLPADSRAILTGFSIEYLKKARGTLLAECRCPVPAGGADCEQEISGEIRDGSGALVATVRARWRIGPVPPG